MIWQSPAGTVDTLSAVEGSETSRNLQSRLVVLSQLMFWSYGALLVLMALLYLQFPAIEPKHNTKIYGLGVLGMLVLVVIWRGFLVRRPLSMRALITVDVVYATLSGSIFAASTLLAYDLQMAITANILWTCFYVFLRTIVVPSTGERTAIVSAIAMAPSIATSAILPLITTTEFPLPALVGSTLLVSGLVVALATFCSRLIYGLRIQASAAMRLGQYTLGAKIADGGHGSVYRANHALLRRPAAIKLIRPDRVDAETLDRFEREVQHMSQLTHPNTVAVYDYGRDPDGMFYYAMEYLDGIDLQKLVDTYGAQPSDRVTAILVQVCGALHEAHNHGVIHRDIKPGNIILCERGDVPDVAKVVDFGLVKEITGGDRDRTGRIFGTPAYLAPESITDPERLGPAADLYALGAVGYFLVTGRTVFTGKTSLDVCIQHATTTPTPPSQYVPAIAPELEALLLRCLAKDPQERPASASELARLLRAVPARSDWSEAQATAWWSERTTASPSTSAATQTITVDLGARDPENENAPRRTVIRRA